MGYFQVRYDSRVVNYDYRGFIRLATGRNLNFLEYFILYTEMHSDWLKLVT